MKKSTWMVILAVIIILVVSGIYLSKNSQEKSNSMQKEDTTTTKEEDKMMQKDENAIMEKEKDADIMQSSGSYESYSPEKLALAENGDVVLFFRASWCPTCRALDADIKANMKNIPAGVTILDVDYDNSTSLKQKYGVTYQHTLVQVDSSGNQITKWMGSPTLASLITNIK